MVRKHGSLSRAFQGLPTVAAVCVKKGCEN